jgi:hypothetical protein
MFGEGLVKEITTGALDAAIDLDGGAQLGQEDDGPDGAPILGVVARARLDPIALFFHRIEDRGDGATPMGPIPGSQHIGVAGRQADEIPQGEVTHAGIVVL